MCTFLFQHVRRAAAQMEGHRQDSKRGRKGTVQKVTLGAWNVQTVNQMVRQILPARSDQEWISIVHI